MSQRGFTVVGIDLSEQAISRARAAYGGVPSLAFAAADATRADTLADRTFDAVPDRGCFHTIPPALQAAYARNLARWTRPAGPILLSVRLGGELDATGWREQIDRVLGADFEVVEAIDDASMASHKAAHGMMFRLTRRHAGVG